MSSALVRRVSAVLLLLLLGGALFLLYRQNQRPALPAGIAGGNGRLEAVEVDVATKVAGRLAKVLPHEGDNVTAGQVVAELDADDLRAQLRAAEAQIRQARAALQESRAGLNSAVARQRLAELTLNRSKQLVKQGYISGDRLDQDSSAVQTAQAGVEAARSQVAEAEAAVGAAVARVDVLRVTLDDTSIKAPLSGRVLYRLAEPGEVLAGGGKILTLHEMSDINMSIYLPTAEAGKLTVGSAARIVLDALPGQVLPAKVVFVAPHSQFTPKEVETRNEREKLMFRIKVKLDGEWLASHADLAKPGMPGMAYVMTAPDAVWPANLTLQ
ncbi:MAG: HlyD family efflux transporter periplasmic adaptor subunit [Chitinivorax sp.]|jgi:HlyD family secretion protein